MPVEVVETEASPVPFTCSRPLVQDQRYTKVGIY